MHVTPDGLRFRPDAEESREPKAGSLEILKWTTKTHSGEMSAEDGETDDDFEDDFEDDSGSDDDDE